MWGQSLIGSDTQLNRDSYYEASVVRGPVRAALQEHLKVDALVIGAGFTGLSAALEMAQRGLRVAVLEADRIGSGASGRNGGQAIVGYASGQAPFEEQLGREDAERAWAMSVEAVDLIDRRIEQHGIVCDRRFGYVHAAESARKARELRQEMDAYAARGIGIDWAEGAEVRRLVGTDAYAAAARETRSGHLHPLKYALGLARAAEAAGVRIFEGSAVNALQRGATLIARTAQGRVSADFGVLAGNCMLPEYGPAVAPEIAPRTMPVGTYILGTAPVSADLAERLIPQDAAVCDNNFVLDYYRFSAERRLLFGGRVSYTTMTPRHLQDSLRARMVALFPEMRDVAIEHLWGGFVDISMNRAPDFGRLGHNLYYLQGFSGHGVALTGLAGQLVAEAVLGQAARFDLFARLRHKRFPGGALLRTPSLALGMWWHRLRNVV